MMMMLRGGRLSFLSLLLAVTTTTLVMLVLMMNDDKATTVVAAAAWAYHHPSFVSSSSSSKLLFTSVHHHRSLTSSPSSSFSLSTSSSRLFCSSSSSSSAVVSTSAAAAAAAATSGDDCDDEAAEPSSSSSSSSTTTTASSSSSSLQLLLWKELCCRFQGDYDNYRQVVVDRAQGKLPRQGGGHEHIHCLLIPVHNIINPSSSNTVNGNGSGGGGGGGGEQQQQEGRLAAFYFDGNPGAIFRFRYYHILPPTSQKLNGSSSSSCIEMVLHTLHPALEGQLRAISTRDNGVLTWPHIFETFVQQHGIHAAVTQLPNCNVQWSFDMDPIQHAYAVEKHTANMQKQQNNNNDNDPKINSSSSSTSSNANDSQNCNTNDSNKLGIHAVMTCGEALVDSQMMPGQQILIRDQLSLWHDEFWIHDRGYNPTTMEYIYGNQANVPYQLQKVSHIVTTMDSNNNNNNNIVTNNDNDMGNKEKQQQQQPLLQRHVVDQDLAWTLGPDFRTPSEYQDKLDAVGGPSAKGAPAARLIKE